jgi:hypothetical protein
VLKADFSSIREQSFVTIHLNQVAEDNLFEGKGKEGKIVLVLN